MVASSPELPARDVPARRWILAHAAARRRAVGRAGGRPFTRAPARHHARMRNPIPALLLAAAAGLLAAADGGEERSGLVHGRNGAALTLVGPALAVGQPAPPATLRDGGLRAVPCTWNDGKVRIVTTAPSLDTPTCSKQAHAFSARAAGLGAVEVVLVSRDLPFAQSRFCATEGITGIRVLSDYYDGSFAHAWGLFLKENGLLARAAAVVDGQGVVRYLEIVPELAREPDYEAVLAAAKALAPH